MDTKLILIPIIIVVTLLAIFAVASNPPPTIDPPTTPVISGECNNMCYNISGNYNTNGYDPQFLKLPLVKTTCLDALRDGKTLGYCSNRLGTL